MTTKTETDTKTDRQRALMATQGYMPATEAAARSGYDISHIYGLVKGSDGKAPKVHGVRLGERGWYVQRRSLVAYIGQEASEVLGLTEPLKGEAVVTESPLTEADPDDLLTDECAAVKCE